MQDGLFKDHSTLDEKTLAASGLAIFTINGNQMLAVSNFFDSVGNTFSTESRIFRWGGNSFTLSQRISTKGSIDVEYFAQGGEHFLVFANTKGDVEVYKWTSGSFVLVQSIPTVEVKSAKTYNYNGKGMTRHGNCCCYCCCWWSGGGVVVAASVVAVFC